MAKMSRDKGKIGEREAAQLLREHGFEARRGAQFQGGPDSPDVVHSIPNVHIEVKRCETLSLYKALDQANAEKRPGDVAVVLHRRNKREWVAVLSATDILRLLARVGSRDTLIQGD